MGGSAPGGSGRSLAAARGVRDRRGDRRLERGFHQVPARGVRGDFLPGDGGGPGAPPNALGSNGGAALS